MKFLAVVPARGGSKGIPKKNIVDLGGKPLIAWTIEATLSLENVELLVSTDDETIAQVSARYGAPTIYRRPLELATDTATTLDAIMHAVQWSQQQGKQFQAVILLQPTSPLRTTEHIQQAIALWQQDISMPVVSVYEPQHSPYLLFSEQENGRWQRLSPLPKGGRRQDVKQRFAQLNGAIYIQSIERLQAGKGFFEEENTRFYFMSAETSVDIDTPLDLTLARVLLTEHH